MTAVNLNTGGLSLAARGGWEALVKFLGPDYQSILESALTSDDQDQVSCVMRAVCFPLRKGGNAVRQVIGANLAVPIMRATDKFKHVPKILAAGTAALHLISFTAGGLGLIANHLAPNFLAECITTKPKSRVVDRAALSLARKLSERSDAFRMKLAMSDVFPILVEGSRQMNTSAFWTLYDIVKDGRLKRSLWVTHNLIDLLVALIASDNVQAVNNAILLTYALVTHDEIKADMSRDDFIDGLAKAIHVVDASFLDKALSSIAHLASKETSKERFVARGVHKWLRRHAYSRNSDTRDWVARCYCIFSAAEGFHHQIVGEDDLDAIFHLIHPDEGFARFDAMRALVNISAVEKHMALFPRQRALGRLLRQENPSYGGDIGALVTKVIANLASNELCTKRLISLGTLPLLIGYLKTGTSPYLRLYPEAGEQVIRALANMASNGGANFVSRLFEDEGVALNIIRVQTDKATTEARRYTAMLMRNIAFWRVENQKLVNSSLGDFYSYLDDDDDETVLHMVSAINNITNTHLPTIAVSGFLRQLAKLALDHRSAPVRRLATKATRKLLPESYQFSETAQNHTSLQGDMRALFKSARHPDPPHGDACAPDITLSVPIDTATSEDFHVHAVILVARCERIAQMIAESSSSRIELPRELACSREAWLLFFEFLYTGSIAEHWPLVRDQQASLTTLADWAELPQLTCRDTPTESELARDLHEILFSQRASALADITFVELDTEEQGRRRRKSRRLEGGQGERDEKLILKAHRVMLAARSKYFRAQFGQGNAWRDSGATRVSLEAPERVLKTVLRFIYGGKGRELTEELDQDPSLALETLVVADRYGFQGIHSLCESVLIKCVDRRNVFALLEVTQVVPAHFLHAECIRWCLTYGGTLVRNALVGKSRDPASKGFDVAFFQQLSRDIIAFADFWKHQNFTQNPAYQACRLFLL